MGELLAAPCQVVAGDWGWVSVPRATERGCMHASNPRNIKGKACRQRQNSLGARPGEAHHGTMTRTVNFLSGSISPSSAGRPPLPEGWVWTMFSRA